MKASGQFFSFGNDPSSVNWSQIRSENFKVIFPAGMDSLAREYVTAMERLRPAVTVPMRIDPDPVPVVLHPYTTLSNGSVSWAPKVVNLITSPDPYDATPDPWANQLVSHEMRHIAQTQHYTRGLFSYLYYGLGEQSAGLAMGLFSSAKFLEGDAVLSETEVLGTGRGRSASFLMYPRALYLEGKYWNWEQSTLGSYHFNSISPYAMGYMMLSQERLRSDDPYYSGKFFKNKAHMYDITKFLEPRASWKIPAQDTLLDRTQRYYAAMWRDDMHSRGKESSYERISHYTDLYCDYTGVLPVRDTLSSLNGTLLAVKKGLEYPCELVGISPDGTERHISYHNQVSSKLSDAPAGRVFWSETVYHGAASLENFSEIRYYDLRSGKSGSLTTGTRYFNPAVSPDGKLLTVAEYPVSGGTSIVLLSAENGCVLATCPAPDRGQILESCFCRDTVYATVVCDGGVGIFSIPSDALPAGRWQCVVPCQKSEIRGLRASDGNLYFAGDIDGVLNIYWLDLNAKGLKRLTNSRFGAASPYVDGLSGLLYYSEFNTEGYHLAKATNYDLKWADASFGEPRRNSVAEDLAAQHDAVFAGMTGDGGDYFDEKAYPAEKYDKLHNSFHIHSWAPLYYNVDRIMAMSMDHYYDLASLGATAYSQNELGTVVAMAGYGYHNGFHSLHGKVTAKVRDFDVEAAVDFNDRKRTVIETKEEGEEAKPVPASGPYFQTTLTVDYPYNLYGGGWQSSVIPLAQLTFSNDTRRIALADGTMEDHLSGDFRLGARYYRMLPVAKAAIFPRWGFSVSAYGQAPLPSGGHFAPLAYLNVYGYLPGAGMLQGIKLSATLQRQYTEGGSRCLSGTIATMPRGCNGYLPSADYAKVTADYAIPVWLNDFCIPHVLYVKRLQLIPFVDVAYDRNSFGKHFVFGSVGSDITVDFNLLRIGFEMNAGIRIANTLPLPEGGTDFYIGPLFGVSIK